MRVSASNSMQVTLLPMDYNLYTEHTEAASCLRPPERSRYNASFASRLVINTAKRATDVRE